MQGRSAAEQREAVMAGFPRVPPWFRKAFPYSKWGAELNARITPAFFTWLVGPMQTTEATLSDGITQKSGVHIERCRCVRSGCRHQNTDDFCYSSQWQTSMDQAACATRMMSAVVPSWHTSRHFV